MYIHNPEAKWFSPAIFWKQVAFETLTQMKIPQKVAQNENYDLTVLK